MAEESLRHGRRSLTNIGTAGELPFVGGCWEEGLEVWKRVTMAEEALRHGRRSLTDIGTAGELPNPIKNLCFPTIQSTNPILNVNSEPDVANNPTWADFHRRYKTRLR